MTSMNSLFEKHLIKTGLLSPGETVWVACSGGADSVALFHLLNTLPEKWKLRVGVLHFNHALRGNDSNKDAQFVRQMAKQAKAPFFVGKAKRGVRQVKKSLEESAREARFQFFSQAANAKKISKIALAHHRDDQAETVLMRILQGTGTRGLLGVREKMKIRQTVFIRPLLPFTKKEIESYLKQNRINYRTDKSNFSRQYLRNRVRQELIPWLEKEINPNVTEALARLPKIFTEKEEWLSELETVHWNKVVKQKIKGGLCLYRGRFLKVPKPVQFRLLDRALKSLDPANGMNFEAWERIKPKLNQPKMSLSLPRDMEMTLTPSVIQLSRKAPRRGLHS